MPVLGGSPSADSGWGSIEAGWDAESFITAMTAPPAAEVRQRLIGNLIDAYFQSARVLASGHTEAFVSLDEGLAVMSRHAQALGYDAVILFLDGPVRRLIWPLSTGKARKLPSWSRP